MRKMSFTFDKKAYAKGFRDGIPIGLGYFAVAFSLGIAARNAGGEPFPGFMASLLTIASAGEYAAFTTIGELGTYIEMALVIFVANCRYLLMSCAMSQRTAPETGFFSRLAMGSFITDEIFAVSIAEPGYMKPEYTYGAASSAVLPWALGTMLGIMVGNIMPVVVVGALSVSLYGMFIAIIVPPAKKDRVVAVLIAVSFAVSFASDYIPVVNRLSGSLKIIVFTVLIAAVAAVLFPVKEEAQASECGAAEGASSGEDKE
ncbi:MAG: AzlC family ABC transporter permease [Clostridia bacterium]|nr:AzlC family ABC transporter permease [Clostridia bacterium]